MSKYIQGLLILFAVLLNLSTPVHAASVCTYDDAVALEDTDWLTLSRNCSGTKKASMLMWTAYIENNLNLDNVTEGATNKFFTTELAQDACGAMVDSTIVYTDATPLLSRAALTGDVTASAGSNTTAIATGVIVDADINASAAISATKLIDGSITDTELGYINTLSSNAQTQISAKQASDATLTAIAAYNTNGILTQTAADTFTGRTITGTSNEISLSNGDGVSGNPTISLPSTIDLGGKTSLEIPNSAAPTVDAAGEIAFDTTVTDFAGGVVRAYSGAEYGLIMMPIGQYTSPVNGYVPTYNSTTDTFELAAASAVVADGDKGEISITGGTWTIDNDVVTYAKMQNISATDRLLGRDTASAGDTEELTVGGGLEFTGSGGIQTSAFTGDVTKTAGGTALTIAATSVTNSMLAGSIDLTTKVTGTLPAANGGTANGFTAFTGPTTSTKTFTLPNATSTILTSNAAVTVAQGGTGLATLTANNVILGNGTSTPTFVAPGTSGNVLKSNGTTWTSGTISATGLIDTQTFTASGTWTKPGSGTIAVIYGCGGGGSGASAAAGGGGGGGGACFTEVVPLSELDATETVTIGAGGASVSADTTDGNAGGNTTLGTKFTFYGGAGGGNSSDVSGGGAGKFSKGANPGNTSASAVPSDRAELYRLYAKSAHTIGGMGGAPFGGLPDASGANSWANGDQDSIGEGGGAGGANNATALAARRGGHAINGGGGGGGGGSTVVIGGDGGNSVYGGGGGGGGAGDSAPGAGAGGVSTEAGNGGAGAYDTNNATAGSAPAGGGGGSETGDTGAGARGELIVWVY